MLHPQIYVEKSETTLTISAICLLESRVSKCTQKLEALNRLLVDIILYLRLGGIIQVSIDSNKLQCYHSNANGSYNSTKDFPCII